jgi:ankyrin repeat protein
MELITNSKLYEELRPESGSCDTFDLWCIVDLTIRTDLNVEQLHRTIIGLDISIILDDNRILNILGQFGFRNYDALCFAYVKHVEEHLDGVFANVDELGDYVKNTIRKYTCIDGVLLENQTKCCTCIDAVNNKHLWCLKRMKHDIIDPKYLGIMDYALLKDDLEIIKYLHKNGAKFLGSHDTPGPLLKLRINEILDPLGCYRYDFDRYSYIRSLDVMKYAIEQRFDFHYICTTVAIFGNLELVKFLYENNHRWDNSSRLRRTLILATASNNVDLVKYIIENSGIDIKNAIDDKLITIAVRNDNMNMLRYLISIKSPLDNAAYDSAIINKNLPMLKMLFEYNGSDDLSKNMNHAHIRDMFRNAFAVNCIDTVRYLIDLGLGSIPCPSFKCDWYVHSAIHYGRPEILKLFLENGNELSPNHYIKALDRDSFECFKVLQEFKCPKPPPEGYDWWLSSYLYNEDIHEYMLANGHLANEDRL